jgi:hypothetical protein
MSEINKEETYYNFIDAEIFKKSFKAENNQFNDNEFKEEIKKKNYLLSKSVSTEYFTPYYFKELYDETGQMKIKNKRKTLFDSMKEFKKDSKSIKNGIINTFEDLFLKKNMVEYKCSLIYDNTKDNNQNFHKILSKLNEVFDYLKLNYDFIENMDFKSLSLFYDLSNKIITVYINIEDKYDNEELNRNI